MTRGLSLDIRAAWRGLARSPGFAAAAVACLSLGIGANSALLTMLDATLLNSPPGIVASDHLVTVSSRRITVPGLPGEGFLQPLSYSAYRANRERSEVFEELAAFETTPLDLGTQDGVERVTGQLVSSNYFRALGVALAGRGFLDEEENTAQATAVLSDDLKRRLGLTLEPGSGPRVQINGRAFTIVGIAPPGFHGTLFDEKPDVWICFGMAGRLDSRLPPDTLTNPRFKWIFGLVGRLRSRLSFEVAAERLEIQAERIGGDDPDGVQIPRLELHRGVGLRPGQRGRLAVPLFTLLSLVGAALLVACFNVANLIIARANARRTEIGVRLALGATRARVARKLLIESSFLAVAAGLVGLGICFLATRALVGVRLGQYLPPLPRLSIGWWELAERARLGRLLIVGQVAGSLTLLIGAGLLARSLLNVTAVDPGFSGWNVLNVPVDLELQGYDQTRGTAFYRKLLEDVSGLPGVDSATLAFAVPLGAGGGAGLVAPISAPDGGDHPEGQEWTTFNAVGPAYFTVTGIRLLAGRDFDLSDRADAPLVAVVNRTFGKALRPDGDAVGLRPRLFAALVGCFGVLAGIVSLIGLYGAVACAVSRQRQEIGIRMALGAQPGSIVRGYVKSNLI